MSDEKLALQMAIEATKAASHALLEHYQQMHHADRDEHVRMKGSALDLVTDADTAAQKAAVDVLHGHFPDHRFITEEEGTDTLGDPESPYVWIIDPLDGTTCFVHGRTNFGTMIALQYNGQTELGVMDMPLRELFFVGQRGHGVTCNGNSLTLRKTKNMSDAVLCCNTIRRARKGTDGVLRIAMPACASIENYGSAVEEFAEILLGHNDGAFFDGIRLWDIAAGCFMLEELGGRYEAMFQEVGNPRSGMLVAASTLPIFDELRRIVFEERIAEQ